MSGSENEHTRLRDAISKTAADAKASKTPQELAALLDDASGTIGIARMKAQKARETNDFERLLGQSADVILTWEAAAGELKQAEAVIANLRTACEGRAKFLRAALAKAAHDSGAPSLETETHTITPVAPRTSVEITDEALLPIDCTDTITKPKLDVIGARLTLKMKVPGARLKTGEPSIRLTAKQVNRGEFA